MSFLERFFHRENPSHSKWLTWDEYWKELNILDNNELFFGTERDYETDEKDGMFRILATGHDLAEVFRNIRPHIRKITRKHWYSIDQVKKGIVEVGNESGLPQDMLAAYTLSTHVTRKGYLEHGEWHSS